MMDKAQLKNDGLLFGRNLHKALKIASMYASVDHSAAEMAAQQAYASLHPLLKQTREFTLGFMNKRLLLNNILTGDNPLAALEAEFTKRGIATVTFEAGLTLREFKQGLSLLCTASKTLEKLGGIKPLLEHNPLPRMRIVPAVKRLGEGGDTVLALASESYLLAQGILEPQVGTMDGTVDLILRSLGSEKPAGSGGGAGEILDLAGKAIERTLADPGQDLHEAVRSLTRLFEQLTPDYLLASLNPEKQTELRGHPAEDVAIDLVEDVTVGLAGKQLTSASPGPLSPTVVEDVMRVVRRSLKATQVAERLLQKLARFIEEAHLPQEIIDRIRQEVVWFSLPEQEKHDQLLRLERFEAREFRRLVNYLHDRVKDGKINLALELTDHYFTCLERAPADVAAEQLAHAPELLRVVAGPETPDFLRKLARRLSARLTDEKGDDRELHRQLANCLVNVAHSTSLYEDFKLVQSIGLDLKNSVARDPTRHCDCCGLALRSLLTPSAADRLVELYLENRDDATWAKTVVGLFKLVGALGAEGAFHRLAEEPAASNRLRLLRLIEQLGAPAIEAGRKRLADNRWYVVRNACHLLGNLGDPDLSSQLRSALRHPEVRVQQAAVTAIIRNQSTNRAVALADALPHLKGQVLEITLDELTFLKDSAIIDPLEQFIHLKKGTRTGGLEKAVRVLAAIPSDRAVEVLSGVLADARHARPVRRAALIALSCSSSPHAHRLMYRFSRSDPKDDLVAECQSLLGASQP